MKESNTLKPTLVIMAAGMGSRYGGLKQMDPVGPNGETLLEYSIYDAIRAGFGKAVFVIRRDFETDFKARIGSRFEKKIDVQYAYQALDDLPAGYTVPSARTKPWGTGQAVLACKAVVQEAFAVQNADDFYGAEAYTTIAAEFSRMSTGDSYMVGYLLRNTLSPNGYVSRGICEAKEGYLSSILERTRIKPNATGVIQSIEGDHTIDMTGDEICSMNFWGFSPDFFQTLEEKFIAFLQQQGNKLKSEWYIPSVVDEMITSGQTRVKVLSSDGQWFGVTYAEDKPLVAASLKKMHAANTYPSPLW